MDENHEPRIVGELKTPWTIDLAQKFSEGVHIGGNFRQLTGKTYRSTMLKMGLRFSSGQVSNYMSNARLKYAFISTYDQTIFFKEDVCEDGEIGLAYSRVIHHRTSSTSDTAADNYPVNQVSLRECMLHLLVLVSKPESVWRSVANTKRWNRKKAAVVDHLGLPDNGLTFTPSPGGSGSKGSAIPPLPQGGAGSYSSHSTGASQYRNIDPQREGIRSVSASLHQEPVRVKIFNDLYWHKLHNNKPQPVEDWKVENGQLLVKIDGQRRLAVVIPDQPQQKVHVDAMIPMKKRWYTKIL